MHKIHTTAFNLKGVCKPLSLWRCSTYSVSFTIYSLFPLPLPSRSAVFTSNKLLVVVAELRGDERDALDMVPVVTTALLEEHQLVTGIVVIVDPGEISGY